MFAAYAGERRESFMMTKRRKGILWGLWVLVVLCSLTACSSKSEGQTGASPEEAMIHYLSEERQTQVAQEELETMIFGSFQRGKEDRQYYLLKDHQDIGGEASYCAYILKVTPERDDSYRCEKVAADVGMGAVDAQKSAAEGERSAGWEFPVDDFRIYIGRILGSEYQPYFEGKKLQTDAEGFFFYHTTEEDTEPEFR